LDYPQSNLLYIETSNNALPFAEKSYEIITSMCLDYRKSFPLENSNHSVPFAEKGYEIIISMCLDCAILIITITASNGLLCENMINEGWEFGTALAEPGLFSTCNTGTEKSAVVRFFSTYMCMVKGVYS